MQQVQKSDSLEFIWIETSRYDRKALNITDGITLYRIESKLKILNRD